MTLLKSKFVKLSLILFLAGVAIGIVLGIWLTRNIPAVDSLQFSTPHLMTRVYSRNGKIINEYGVEKRTLVHFSEISPNFIHALLAVEDAGFYRHHGVSIRGVVRALYQDLLHGSARQGGSTLTQQLARQYFLTPRKTIKRKIREAILAVNIESHYSKEQILEMYVNKVCFGSAYYGVEASARHFFGKPASELTVPEAALLAGLVQRPGYFAPKRHPARALRRRNHVLKRMMEVGYINQKQYEDCLKSPLGLHEDSKTYGGVGAYVTERVRMYVAKKYGENALYRQGLRITTTLDVSLQQAAEKAVRDGLDAYSRRRGYRGPAKDPSQHREYTGGRFEEGNRYWATVTSVRKNRITASMGKTHATLTPENWKWAGRFDPRRVLRNGNRILLRVVSEKPKLAFRLDQPPLAQGALTALDPHSGEVLALVGGYDFTQSMFNRAIQARRQTGSAVKPIVYASALLAGDTLASSVVDTPTLFLTGREKRNDEKGRYQLCEVGYLPHDFDPDYFGLTTYATALAHSINIDAVRVLNRTGFSRTISLAKSLHISTKLQPFPSMALGAFGISLYELTGAYTAFDNGGIWTKPHFIRSITDRNGKSLELFTPESNQAMSPEVAYLMTQALVGVIKHGTGVRASDLKGHFAGKTGTTDDYTDSWFIGYNPAVLCGVWAGKDDHTSLGNLQTGARVALPIWKAFMEKACANQEDLDWAKPEGVVKVMIDAQTGLRAGIDSPCRKVIPQFFLKGTEPTTYCSRIDHFRLKLPYFLQTYELTPQMQLVIPEADVAAWVSLYPSTVARSSPDTLIVSWKGSTFPVRLKIAPPREGPVPQAVMPGLPHEGDVVCGGRVVYLDEKR